MTRPLLTLLVGVLATVVVAILLTGGAPIPSGFGAVGLTIVAGAVVMAVVARRAALRRRAGDLEREDLDEPSQDAPARSDGRHHLPSRGAVTTTDDVNEGTERG